MIMHTVMQIKEREKKETKEMGEGERKEARK